MTALDKQMDEMLIEINYLKSDEYVNNLKADAVEFAAGQINGQCDGELGYDMLISNVGE